MQSTIGEALGDGFCLRWILASPEFVHEETDPSLHNWQGGAYTLVGMTLLHSDDEGHPCQMTISLIPHQDGDARVWRVDRVDPLTISPAIECDRCHSTGSIRDGQWHDDGGP